MIYPEKCEEPAESQRQHARQLSEIWQLDLYTLYPSDMRLIPVEDIDGGRAQQPKRGRRYSSKFHTSHF